MIRRSSIALVAVLAALVLSLAAPLPAFAQAPAPVPAPAPPPTEDDRAAVLKKRGDDAMDSLRYDEALAAYREAYDVSKNPALLYNIGRVLQARGDFPAALDNIERFDREASPELKAKVPKLGELIAELRAKVAIVTVTCNVEGARILVRERQVATTPLPSPLRVNAGKAMVEVAADGYYPFKQEMDLRGGATTAIDAKLSTKATSGILAVKASVVGAVIFVDGQRAGVTPVEIVVGAGEHKILAHREGFDDAQTSAVVTAGERRDVSVTLQAKAGITSKWWFWTSVGVVVVGGVALSYALLTEKKAPGGEQFAPGQVSGPLLKW